MIADALSSGHVLLADWLFLLAAIVFVVEAVAPVVADRADRVDGRRSIGRGILLAVGLALLAVGWLVL
jgi:hypothetical protein